MRNLPESALRSKRPHCALASSRVQRRRPLTDVSSSARRPRPEYARLVLTRARARASHRPPPFLVAVLWLAVLPAVASGSSAPRVVAASHVPLVAAAGDRIAVTAKVAGTGKRVVLGLVLGSPQGSATGGLALGKGVAFSRRGTRRV
ncbi:MAG: hypothetical protein QOI80_1389, partial [Solirubrobacteraceae bacterium]|nr:hypothetical protein [Solirubrobacteraceae bacterium]